MLHLSALALLLPLVVAQGSWPPIARNVTWQYQLSDSGTITVVPGVNLYIIDIDTARTAIPKLRKANPNVQVICYFSAGTWEKYRQTWDTQRGAYSIKTTEWTGLTGAAMADWPDEKWLNIVDPTKYAKVQSIMKRRMQFAKSINCTGVDPDNVDAWAEENTGINGITFDISLAYNKWIAETAHSLGLAVGLKNSPLQVPYLASYYDWFVTESCFSFQECGNYLPAVVGSTKPVFGVQYCNAKQYFGGDYITSNPSCYCAKALENGWNFLVKQVDLGAKVISCAAYCAKNAGKATACKWVEGTCPSGKSTICSTVF